MDAAALHDFGLRYTAAWCSKDPSQVAAFFSNEGSLTINAGAPAVGREAIGAAAEGFMVAFPDLVLTMDEVRLDGDRAIYRWTFAGTHTATTRSVLFSGFEEWEISADGLIACSLGTFDEADYRRQLSA